ncbi:hypothetical protein D3C81_2236580 [compost metagenome]
MGFSRQIGHGLRLEVDEDGGDRNRIGDVRTHETIGGITFKLGQRRSHPGIGQQVENADLVAACQQFTRQG